jgi:hypothetical protein
MLTSNTNIRDGRRNEQEIVGEGEQKRRRIGLEDKRVKEEYSI